MLIKSKKLIVFEKLIKATEPVKLKKLVKPTNKKSKAVASTKFRSGYFLNLWILCLYLSGKKVINLMQVDNSNNK